MGMVAVNWFYIYIYRERETERERDREGERERERERESDRDIHAKNFRINFHLLRTFCPHLGSFFLWCFFFHYVSAKFHLWPSSGDLPRLPIGMLSLVTVSPVITAFHSCCLSHHGFDQVNFWPAWVGFETAIFWQCSPGTIETQRLYLKNTTPLSQKKPYQDEDKKSANK